MKTVREFMQTHRRKTGERRVEAWLTERRWCFSQGDQSIANQAGAAFRADLNLELQALVTQSSGAAAPGTTYAHQPWADTTNSVLKKRNAANSAWLNVMSLDEVYLVDRASNTILGVSDKNKTFRATSGFTQTVTAAATLGDGWGVGYRVESGATLIIDPNGAETIDGAATKTIVGPTSGFIVCNGAAFYTSGFAIPASLLTTAGDIIYATGAGTPARLGIGTALQVLRTNAGATAPEWAAPSTGLTLGTAVASTSGTSIDFTGIPAGTKRVTINFKGVSTSGTSNWIVQIGDAGGIETASYSAAGSALGGAVTTQTFSTGFGFQIANASSVLNGSIVLTLENSTNATWTSFGILGDTANTATFTNGGSKSLSPGPLDRVRITTVGGTDTFDAGEINITYE